MKSHALCWVALCTLLGACSDDPAAPPTTDSAPATCQPSCGAHAICRSDLTCACTSGWLDCNGDLATTGGNGCECNTRCNGAVCAAAPSCSTTEYGVCGSDAMYCAGDGCAVCPTGKANCDGVGDCEGTSPCFRECTNTGGCGDTTKFCDFGKCKACAAGTYNCDLIGDCECTGTCGGTVCRGTTACDYLDQDACGGDTTQWCYQGECRPCSSGFNCNNTKGCECDSAGCAANKTCAGKCSGGECP